MTKLIENYYKSQRDHLVRTLSRRAGSIENAEDVVQEAFYRALRYSNSFYGHTEGELAAWFKTIMYRSLKDFSSHERNQGMAMSEPPEEELSLTTEEIWEHESDIRDVYNLVMAKPEAVSQSLYLYFFGRYRPMEISQILDEPYDTVKKRILRFKVELEELKDVGT